MNLEESITILLKGDSSKEMASSLVSYVDSKEAWFESIQLCSSPHPNIRYFTANIIYTKVQRHWTSQLNIEEQNQIYQLIFQLFLACGPLNSEENKPYVARIILSLVSSSLQTKEGFDHLLSLILNLFDSSNPDDKLKGCELLISISSEYNSLDIGDSKKFEFDEKLNSFSKFILPKLEIIFLSSSHTREVQVRALKVLGCLGSVSSLSIASLASAYPSILQALALSLSSLDPLIVRTGCTVISELIGSKEYPPPPPTASHPALLALLSPLLSPSPGLLSLMGSSEEVAHEVVSCWVEIAERERPFLMTCCSPLPGHPQGLAPGPSLYLCLVQCTALRPRRFSLLGFEAWLSLHQTPQPERPPPLRRPAFRALLLALPALITLPHDWESRDPDSEVSPLITHPLVINLSSPLFSLSFLSFSKESEDLQAVREGWQGLEDVVMAVARELLPQEEEEEEDGSGGEEDGPMCFFQTFSSLFSSLGQDWSRLEALLTLLSLSCPALKEHLQETTQPAPCLSLLQSVLSLVLSLQGVQNTQPQPALLSSACRLIGSLTFLIATHPSFSSSLPPVLTLLFSVAKSSSEASSSALSSLHSLISRGRGSLLSPAQISSLPLLSGIVSESVHLVQMRSTAYLSALPAPHLRLVLLAPLLECVSRTLSALDPSLPLISSSLFSQLSSPLISAFDHCLTHLQSPPPSSFSSSASPLLLDLMDDSLALLSELVRGCDCPTRGDGSHLLSALLADLLPKSLTALSLPFPRAKGRILSLYTSIAQSVPLLLAPHTPLLSSIVLSSLSDGLSTPCTSPALRLALSLCESLPSLPPDQASQSLPSLHNMLETILDLVHRQATAAYTPLPYFVSLDPSSSEAFFSLFYSTLLRCPHLLFPSPSPSSFSDRLPRLCLLGLLSLNEKGSLHECLSLTQALFLPLSRPMQTFAPLILQATSPLGPEFTLCLLRLACLLSPQPSASPLNLESWSPPSPLLAPMFLETLLSLMQGAGQGSQAWVQSALLGEGGVFSDLIRDDGQVRGEVWVREVRETGIRAGSSLVSLSLSDSKSAKTLLQNVVEVVKRERGVESLHEYL